MTKTQSTLSKSSQWHAKGITDLQGPLCCILGSGTTTCFCAKVLVGGRRALPVGASSRWAIAVSRCSVVRSGGCLLGVRQLRKAANRSPQTPCTRAQNSVNGAAPAIIVERIFASAVVAVMAATVSMVFRDVTVAGCQDVVTQCYCNSIAVASSFPVIRYLHTRNRISGSTRMYPLHADQAERYLWKTG